MKKFENAQLEIVKLNMVDIIATSQLGSCDSNECRYDAGAKDSNWDED